MNTNVTAANVINGSVSVTDVDVIRSTDPTVLLAAWARASAMVTRMERALAEDTEHLRLVAAQVDTDVTDAIDLVAADAKVLATRVRQAERVRLACRALDLDV